MAKKEIMIIDELNAYEHELANKNLTKLKDIEFELAKLHAHQAHLLKELQELGTTEYNHLGDIVKLTFESTVDKIDYEAIVKTYGIDASEIKIPKTLNYFNEQKAIDVVGEDKLILKQEFKQGKVKVT
jgi:hypothetical protein